MSLVGCIDDGLQFASELLADEWFPFSVVGIVLMANPVSLTCGANSASSLTSSTISIGLLRFHVMPLLVYLWSL